MENLKISRATANVILEVFKEKTLEKTGMRAESLGGKAQLIFCYYEIDRILNSIVKEEQKKPQMPYQNVYSRSEPTTLPPSSRETDKEKMLKYLKEQMSLMFEMITKLNLPNQELARIKVVGYKQAIIDLEGYPPRVVVNEDGLEFRGYYPDGEPCMMPKVIIRKRDLCHNGCTCKVCTPEIEGECICGELSVVERALVRAGMVPKPETDTEISKLSWYEFIEDADSWLTPKQLVFLEDYTDAYADWLDQRSERKMSEITVGSKVVIKEEAGEWWQFRGKVVEIDENKKIVQVEIPALGKLYRISFDISEVELS